MRGINSKIIDEIWLLNDSSVRSLCMFLSIDFNALRGNDFSEKKQSLINYVSYNQLFGRFEKWKDTCLSIGISYSQPSYDLAIDISQRLSDDGFPVLIDEKNIQDSIGSISRFENELAKQPLFIAILSQRYFVSYHCMRELFLFFKQCDFNKEEITSHILPAWHEHIDYNKLSNTVKSYWVNMFCNISLHGHCSSFDEDMCANIANKCQKMVVTLADISAFKINDNFDMPYSNLKDLVITKLNYLRCI